MFTVCDIDIENKKKIYLLKVEAKKEIDSRCKQHMENLEIQKVKHKASKDENIDLSGKFKSGEVDQQVYDASVTALQIDANVLEKTTLEVEAIKQCASDNEAEIQAAELDLNASQNQYEIESIEAFGYSRVFAKHKTDDLSKKSLITENNILHYLCDTSELKKTQEMIDSYFCLDLNQPLSKVMIKKDVELDAEFPLHGIPYYVEPECDNMSALISQSYILPIMVDRTHYVVAHSILPNMLLSARRITLDHTKLPVTQSHTLSKQSSDKGESQNNYSGEDETEHRFDFGPSTVPLKEHNMIFKDHKFITVRKLFVGEEVIIGCDDLDGNKMEHMVKMALLLSCIKEVQSMENLLGSVLKIAPEQYSLPPPHNSGCTYKSLTKELRFMSWETVKTLLDCKKYHGLFIWLILQAVNDKWDSFFKTHNEADFTSLELLAKEGYPPGISLLANEGFRGRFSFYNYSKGLPVQLDRYAFIQSTIEARQALISAFPILLKRKAIGSEIENATIQCPCCDHQSKHGNARRSYPCPHPALASCKLCAQENELHLNFCEEHMSKHDEHSSAIKMSWQELHERSLSEKSKKYLSEFVDDSEFKITDNCKSVDLAKFIKLKWTCLQKK